MENEKWKILPPAFCFLPSAFCLLLSAFCFLPSAFCLLPSAFCLLLFCGFAAAQCGKAPPFRRFFFFFEAAPQLEAPPPVILERLNGKAEPYRTVRRHSRTGSWTSAS